MLVEIFQTISQMQRPAVAWVMMTLVLVQGLAMLVDEFYFHHRRGLGAWERIGHPLDTFVFMLAIGVLLHMGWTLTSSGLAVFSALLVTKDEWVHRREASAAEQWLHSILFLVQGLILWVAGEWGAEKLLTSQQIALLLGPMIFFGVYQILYWNLWRGRPDDQPVGSQRLMPHERHKAT